MTEPGPQSQQDLRAEVAPALILYSAVAVAVLYGLSWGIRRLPCWGASIAIVLAAYPIWVFLTQRALLRRRAILEHVTKDTSHIARWFWRGTLTQIGLVFVALGLATVLLTVLARLRLIDWVVLAVDAVLVGLVFNSIRRALAGQIKEGHQGLIARLWPSLWGNAALLVVAFVAVDFYSSHELIHGKWLEVIDEAFYRGRQGIACPGVSFLVGMVNVIEQLSWKLAVGTLPYLPDLPTRVIGWIVFLAWTGFGAVVFTQFLLGVVAWADGIAAMPASHAPGRTMWRSFIATIAVLAVLFVYAEWRLSNWKPAQDTAQTSTVASGPVDPCAAFRFDTRALQTTLTGTVDEARLQTHQLADRRIDAMLDTAFGRAEKGVDAYLDWYFSLYGDYSRLFAVMVGDLGQVMLDNLSKHVFDDTGFAQVIEAETSHIQAVVTEQMVKVAGRVPEQVRQAVDASKCPIPSIDLSALIDLNKDRVRAAVSTTSAITVGALTAKAAGKKAAAAAAGKAAASGSIKMAAKIAGKAAAKKGTSSLAAGLTGMAVCSAGGPVAVACGIGAAAIAWVLTDKVVIEAEEYVSRDDMREDILKALAEQRVAAEKELQTIYHRMADAYAVEIQSRADKVFVPARDGL